MNPVTLKPSREEFRELAKKGNVIPVYTELIADSESPVAAFQKIDDADSGGHSFLLESAEKNDQVGRYSFVGSNPRAIFESNGRNIRITEGGKTREYEAAGDPLTELQQFMAQYRVVELPDLPRFTGGAVGFIAYDVVRFFEPSIAAPPKDELQLPEMVFLITDTVLIFDHRLRRLRVLSNAFVADGNTDRAYDEARAQIERIIAKLDQPAHLPNLSVYSQARPISPESNTTREEYLQTVRDTQEYIHAGDIFQIVPSQRFETAYTGDALNLYRSLRFVNPSPYMFCFKFGGKFALVGSSPEVHVRAMNGKVEIRPIAGTRRRGATEEEDEANAKDLLADPKERAEHLMLVDLARNDVGPHRRFRHGARHRFHDHRKIQPRHAHRFECDRRIAERQKRLRRHARHIPRRHRERLAQSARHADHQPV